MKRDEKRGNVLEIKCNELQQGIKVRRKKDRGEKRKGERRKCKQEKRREGEGKSEGRIRIEKKVKGREMETRKVEKSK